MEVILKLNNIGSTCQNSEHDNTESKVIHFEVYWYAQEYLRSNIIRSTTYGLSQICIELYVGQEVSETKINNFNLQ